MYTGPVILSVIISHGIGVGMFGKIDLINVLAKTVWQIGIQSNCYVI